MAGFAVVMTFLSLGLAGFVVASVSAVILYFLAKRHTPQDATNRRTLLTSCIAAPFLGLLWVFLAFIIHVFISHQFAHQDCGLGMSPDPFVTLSNGYVLGSHNTYDGYIKALGVETDVPIAGPGYVRSIIDLDLKDGRFTGTQLDFNSSKMIRFSFDTVTREYKRLDSPAENATTAVSAEDQKLDAFGAAMTKAHDDNNSYWRMYEQNHHRWPGAVFLILLLTGEFFILLWLRRIWQSCLVSENS